jgi:hypothetical protein
MTHEVLGKTTQKEEEDRQRGKMHTIGKKV